MTDARGVTRCSWAAGELLESYHDHEWGVPVHDDRHHFELLVLESAQAGLSWLTILRKREGYRKAFRNFDPAAVAAIRAPEVEELLADPGIVRNRRKVESAVNNARVFLEVQHSFGSFDKYIWSFVDGTPVVGSWTQVGEIPAQTALSQQVSKDLQKKGFRFVGPVVVYSHLQSAGLVMDHVTSCSRYADLAAGAA